MALIVVLSVFNGFEDLVISLYSSFDPDIKISSTVGKSFDVNTFPLDKIKKIEGVNIVSEVLEENALLKYEDKQYIATLKGVSKEFASMTSVDTMIVEGDYILEKGNANYAILGYLIAYNLGIRVQDANAQLSIYVPKRGKLSSTDPLNAFSIDYVMPSGVFSVQQDFDSKYVLLPIRQVRNIIEKPNQVSAIELSIKPNAELAAVQNQLQSLLGSKYEVKNKLQLHDFLYKIMKYEKYAVFLILSFILLLAIFNVIGSLTMLIIEKKKDIAILKSMGASNRLIKNIFFCEGLFITLFGAIAGMILGLIICVIQQQTGLVKLQGGDSFAISVFPISLNLMDFVSVFATVFLIGVFAAWFPVRKISKKHLSDYRSLIVR